MLGSIFCGLLHFTSHNGGVRFSYVQSLCNLLVFSVCRLDLAQDLAALIYYVCVLVLPGCWTERWLGNAVFFFYSGNAVLVTFSLLSVEIERVYFSGAARAW
jgi:hypothetical protein